MKDTSEDIEIYQRKLIYAKPVRERFGMAVEMYEIAREMAIDSIKKLNPGINKKDLKKELFKRFYLNDFSEDEMRIIIENFK